MPPDEDRRLDDGAEITPAGGKILLGLNLFALDDDSDAAVDDGSAAGYEIAAAAAAAAAAEGSIETGSTSSVVGCEGE